MVANPERREALTDAALQVLGDSGSRGLTHRAVDRAAGVPQGSTANYFPSRASLILAMAQRIFVCLAPDPRRLEELADVPQDQAVVDYAVYATERLMADKTLTLALLELRLEAARNPEVSAVLAPFLRAGFEADSAFHDARRLRGGPSAVLVTHHLVTGAVFDALTVPLDPARQPVDEVAEVIGDLFG